MLKRIVV